MTALLLIYSLCAVIHRYCALVFNSQMQKSGKNSGGGTAFLCIEGPRSWFCNRFSIFYIHIYICCAHTVSQYLKLTRISLWRLWTHVNYDSFSTDGYTGDVYLLVKLLLPTAGKKRVYNLQSKQIVKLLSQVCTTEIVLSNC